jgi:hypothetical protein
MNSRRFTAQYLPSFRTKGIAHRGLLRCGISTPVYVADGSKAAFSARPTNVRSTSKSGVKADILEPPLSADIVAKRFCASSRAILVQCQARIRNADSKIHSPRFDCCAFLFYSSVAVTFATISAISRSHVNSRLMSQNLHCTKPLRGGSAVEVGNCNPNSTSPCVLPLSASVSCLAQDVENVHRDDRADDGSFGGFIIRG